MRPRLPATICVAVKKVRCLQAGKCAQLLRRTRRRVRWATPEQRHERPPSLLPACRRLRLLLLLLSRSGLPQGREASRPGPRDGAAPGGLGGEARGVRLRRRSGGRRAERAVFSARGRGVLCRSAGGGARVRREGEVL